MVTLYLLPKKRKKPCIVLLAQTDTSGSRWYVEDRNRGNPVVTFTGPLDYKPYKAPSGSGGVMCSMCTQ